MAKAKSAVDEIAGSIPDRQSPAWEHRVAAEHLSTLAEIKAACRDGKFGRHKITAARAISEYLARHGIAQVGPQGVLAWLQKP